MAESVRSPDVRRRRCSRLGQLETLQRDTSKVSVRPNSIFHSSRLTTTTSNYHRHSADIAGDPEPLTSLPASEPELTSWSRQEVLVGVGDPGARRRRGGGRVERGPPWCGRSRNGGGLSGRRKKTEERIRRRRPAAVSLRSAVARESAAATARRPPSVVTFGNGQVVEAAATGGNQSRRWFLSESRRRVVVAAEIQLLRRRRRRRRRRRHGGMRHASVATLLAYVYYRASVSLQNRHLPPCRRRVLRLSLTWNWTCQ